jgi:hypothetical protein
VAQLHAALIVKPENSAAIIFPFTIKATVETVANVEISEEKETAETHSRIWTRLLSRVPGPR